MRTSVVPLWARKDCSRWAKYSMLRIELTSHGSWDRRCEEERGVQDGWRRDDVESHLSSPGAERGGKGGLVGGRKGGRKEGRKGGREEGRREEGRREEGGRRKEGRGRRDSPLPYP